MTIDPGLAGILGAAVGGALTVAGTWFFSWLDSRKARSLAEIRRSRLRRMLSDARCTWRSLDQLSASVGADDATTLELLIEIDARASVSNARLWALVDRAPWPPETVADEADAKPKGGQKDE